MLEKFASRHSQIGILLKALDEKITTGLGQDRLDFDDRIWKLELTGDTPSGNGGWSSLTIAKSAGIGANL